MSDLRVAAQQALEALGSSLYPQPRQMAAIAALRAALAEPVQEPVAWIYQNSNTDHEYLVWRKSEGGRNWRPLYTAPQRKPLTEEEISSIFRTSGSPTAFARAIEAAHGIGGKT